MEVINRVVGLSVGAVVFGLISYWIASSSTLNHAWLILTLGLAVVALFCAGLWLGQLIKDDAKR